MTGAVKVAWRVAVTAVLGAALGGPVSADVAISGTVKYWDQFQKQYLPARHISVQVEGDWWEPDIWTTTDTNGNFSVKQRDPYWGDFDINIEAYASTPGLAEVYEDMLEAMFEMYPYHAISKTQHNVGAGQTATINLLIGGPQDNVDDVWTRTVAETANAFIVHEHMLAHYKSLSSKGFLPASQAIGGLQAYFNEYEVIVPSAGNTSYYNNVTEFINLVVTNPDKDLVVGGLANWTALSPAPSGCMPGAPGFCVTVRHEYSHAIHDYLTAMPPKGLFMPAEHDPEMDTNRWLAFTEAWAEFLPLVTFGLPHKFDLSADHNATGLILNIPTAVPPGGHWSWEGEVAGVLWDLYDPAGEAEPVRHYAASAGDGTAVPAAIQHAQHWQDRVADPNLARIKQILSAISFPAWGTIDTIEEFLSAWTSTWPNELHAVKTVAFNRDIIKGVPGEYPACLVGTPSVQRQPGSLNTTLQFTVREPDDEDRPFVGIALWHEAASGQCTMLHQETLSGGWNGDQRPVSLNVSVPVPTGQGDRLWLIVSDEMLPMAYALPNPSFEMLVVTVQIQPPPPLIVRAETSSGQPWTAVEQIPPQGPGAGPQRVPDDQVAARIDAAQNDVEALRRAFREADALLEGYGRLLREAEEGEEKLRALARKRGLVPAATTGEPTIATEAIARLRPSQRTGAQSPRGSQLRPQWLQTIAQGGAPPSAESTQTTPAPVAVRQLASASATSLSQRLEAHRTRLTTAPAIARKLQTTFQAAQDGFPTPTAQQNTQQAVQALSQVLAAIAQDREVLSGVEMRCQALSQIANQPAQHAPAVEPGMPQQQPTTAPVGRPPEVTEVPTAPTAPGDQAGPPPVTTAQPPQVVPQTGSAMTETFDAGTPQGWELMEGASVANGVLTFPSPGHAFWPIPPTAGLMLTVQYRPGTGPGVISLCVAGEPPLDQAYDLLFLPGEMTVVRRQGQQVQELGGGIIQLQPNTFNVLSISLSNGQFQIGVGGQVAVQVTDPQPLGPGAVMLGCPEGGGGAFDNVTVAAASPAGHSGAAPGAAQPGQQPVVHTLPTQPVPGQAPAPQPVPGQTPIPEQSQGQPWTQQPTGAVLSENFEGQTANWDFVEGAAVQQVGQGRALICSGPGHAFWRIEVTPPFTLSLRHLHGQGMAELVLAGSGEPPNVNEYRVHLGQGEIEMIRAFGGQAHRIGGAALNLAAGGAATGQWHNLALSVSGGQVQVAVNGQNVLSAHDPNPAPSGFIAFGCIQGGQMGYDDIALAQGGGATARPH